MQKLWHWPLPRTYKYTNSPDILLKRLFILAATNLFFSTIPSKHGNDKCDVTSCQYFYNTLIKLVRRRKLEFWTQKQPFSSSNKVWVCAAGWSWLAESWLSTWLRLGWRNRLVCWGKMEMWSVPYEIQMRSLRLRWDVQMEWRQSSFTVKLQPRLSIK